MNFGEVLSRAWQIIWKNKILWLFGLLASLAAGGDSGSSGLQFNFRGGDGGPTTGWWSVAGNTFNNIPAWAAALLLLAGLVFVIVVIILGTLGRAGLMRGAWLADSGESMLTFQRLFQESRVYFVRVLLLEILLFAAGLAIILMLIIPAVLTAGIALLCLWPLFCLIVPLFLAFGVLFKLAMAGIVGEDRAISDSLRHTWELIRAHPGEVIGMALALILANYLVSFVVSLPMALILAPVLVSIFVNHGAYLSGGAVLSAGLFLLYLPVLLAIRGLIVSYIDTAWTVSYRRLSGRTTML